MVFDFLKWFFEFCHQKYIYFVFLTTSLKIFQFSNVLENLQLVSLIWQFSFHHALECLYQIDPEKLAYSWTMCLRDSLSGIFKVLIFFIALVSSKMKFTSSSLFLIIVWHFSWMNSSVIEIMTVKKVQSDE